MQACAETFDTFWLACRQPASTQNPLWRAQPAPKATTTPQVGRQRDQAASIPDACRNRCVCSPGTTQVVRHCALAPIQRCAAHRESLAWPLHLLSMAKPGVTACDSQDCSSHRCACPGIDCMCAWSLCSRERMVLQVVQSLGQVEQGRWLLHCCPSYVESMPEVHACQQDDFENET